MKVVEIKRRGRGRKEREMLGCWCVGVGVGVGTADEVKMLGSVYKEINYCRAERRYTYSGLSLVKLRIWHGKVRNYEFSVSWR